MSGLFNKKEPNITDEEFIIKYSLIYLGMRRIKDESIDKIFKNENRLWKYDPDKNQWRSYEDLIKTREEIDETYVYSFIAEDVTKGDKKVVVEKQETTLDDVKKMVKEAKEKEDYEIKQPGDSKK